ncbi:hypothetical protein AAMO2058_001148600 [Amorphochlora amoebiformis]
MATSVPEEKTDQDALHATSLASNQCVESRAGLVVAALYKFFRFQDHKSVQKPLLALCLANNVTGTLLLAAEGINGTIAGPRKGIDEILDYIRSIKGVGDQLSYKESLILPHERPEGAFLRMRVRLKKEIVTIGEADVDPLTLVGTYVDPKEWNTLITRKDVTTIDTRNTYETEIGTFKGAVDPRTESFKEFPKWVDEKLDPNTHPNVAMFCTGGIRCEKATSLLLRKGFKNVYHLKGGILNYLKEVPKSNSTWEGECYVFDERVSVDHHLRVGTYAKCRACRRPVSESDLEHKNFELGVSCHRCISEYTEDQRTRFRNRHNLVKLAKSRGKSHLGITAQPPKTRAMLQKKLEKYLPNSNHKLNTDIEKIPSSSMYNMYFVV